MWRSPSPHSSWALSSARYTARDPLVLIAWLCALVLLVAGSLAIRKTASTVGRSITHHSYPAAGAIVRLVATGVATSSCCSRSLACSVSPQSIYSLARVSRASSSASPHNKASPISSPHSYSFRSPFRRRRTCSHSFGHTRNLDVDVLEIGLTYVTVRTEDGILRVPNSVMLASGIGQFHAKAPTPPTPPAMSNSDDPESSNVHSRQSDRSLRKP